MAANGAFLQTLIFFQHYFCTAFRARRIQRSQRATIQGKKYQRYKNIFKHFLELQKSLYSARAQRSAFFQHKSQDSITRRLLQSAHTNFPTCLYTMIVIHTFPLSFVGGLMRMKNSNTYQESNQQINVRRWGPTLQRASGRKVLTSPAVPNITSVGALEPRELCTFAGELLPTIRRTTMLEAANLWSAFGTCLQRTLLNCSKFAQCP